MSSATIRVLLVGDDAADARRIAALLAGPGGFELTRIGCLSAAAERLEAGGYDIVLLDLALPGARGIEAIGRLQGAAPDVPIIAVHGGPDADDPLLPCAAARGGAQDVLPKGSTDAPLMRRAILAAIERKRLERCRVRWGRHDEATGLPDRLLLGERFERAALRARRAGMPMAVLAVELDHFTHIIEQTGAELGDRLLRGAAERLRGVLRRTDTLARPGRRGFVALIEGLRRAEDAGVVAGKLLRYLARPFYVDGHEVNLTASIGIVVLAPEDGTDLTAAIRGAEHASFAAAAAGGGRAVTGAPAARPADDGGPGTVIRLKAGGGRTAA